MLKAIKEKITVAVSLITTASMVTGGALLFNFWITNRLPLPSDWLSLLSLIPLIALLGIFITGCLLMILLLPGFGLYWLEINVPLATEGKSLWLKFVDHFYYLGGVFIGCTTWAICADVFGSADSSLWVFAVSLSYILMLCTHIHKHDGEDWWKVGLASIGVNLVFFIWFALVIVLAGHLLRNWFDVQYERSLFIVVALFAFVLHFIQIIAMEAIRARRIEKRVLIFMASVTCAYLILPTTSSSIGSMALRMLKLGRGQPVSVYCEDVDQSALPTWAHCSKKFAEARPQMILKTANEIYLRETDNSRVLVSLPRSRIKRLEYFGANNKVEFIEVSIKNTAKP